MRKTNRILISFILAIMMLITVVPAVGANSVEAVDLIHDTDGDLRQGVYIHSNRDPYGTQSTYCLNNAFDNDESTAWLSKNGSVVPYLQVNFPVSQELSEITVKPSKKSGYDVHKPFDVRVSNDYDFETYETLASFTASDWETGDFSSKTITVESEEKYKYVRLVWTNTNKWAALAEIDISGYEEQLPSVEDSTELTTYPDVLAYSIGYYGTSMPQKAIDGNESTQFYDPTAVSGKYIIIDLKRAALIDRIDLLPLSSYETTNEKFRVQVSNDPTFVSFTEIYYRDWNDVPAGKYAVAYGRDNEGYRYVRVIKTDSQLLGFKEIKVWGVPEDESVIVENIAKNATITTSDGTDASVTTDDSFDETWSSAAENASVTYIFDESKVVTSISVLTRVDELSARNNFNIYGSASGTFEDAELLGSVGEDAIADGMFTNFGIDDIKAYKAIKIEKTGVGQLALSEVRFIHDSSDTKVEVVKTTPSDGQTNITNIDGAVRLLEVELNRSINELTITPDNILITNLTTQTAAEDWEAYSVDGKTFTIDIANFESNSEYSITLTTGVKAGVLPLTEEYTFTFTTDKIINAPYQENKIIKNIAVGKTVTGNSHNSYGSIKYMCDGSEDNNYTHTKAGQSPNLQVDLGNFYDVVAFEILHHSYIDGLEVRTSSGNVEAKNMTDTVATFVGNVKQTVLSEPAVRTRYIGLTRGNTTYTVIKEFKVYALVSEDFGVWTSSAEEITGAGTYTFSLPVTNYTDNENKYYMLVGAYDASGAMTGLTCDEVTAAKDDTSTLSASITIDEKTEKIKAILVKGLNNASMIVDMKMISKPVAAE